MRLRYETHGPERALTRHPFRSAFAVAATSAALLLTFATVNPVFANKAPLQASDSSFSWTTTRESASQARFRQKYDFLWETKVKHTTRVFRQQNPHSNLIEQDYSVIKKLNDSLPPAARISVSTWLFYQQNYSAFITAIRGRDVVPPAMKANISAAVARTKRIYAKELAAEVRSKKPPAQKSRAAEASDADEPTTPQIIGIILGALFLLGLFSSFSQGQSRKEEEERRGAIQRDWEAYRHLPAAQKKKQSHVLERIFSYYLGELDKRNTTSVPVLDRIIESLTAQQQKSYALKLLDTLKNGKNQISSIPGVFSLIDAELLAECRAWAAWNGFLQHQMHVPPEAFDYLGPERKRKYEASKPCCGFERRRVPYSIGGGNPSATFREQVYPDGMEPPDN